MGKNYSYTVVVETSERLVINDKAVGTPAEVTSGEEDILGWALSQVRAQYASLHAQDQSSELTLMVQDRRPGGVHRRRKFVHPDEGITLEFFHGRGSAPADQSGEGSADSAQSAPPQPPQSTDPSELPSKAPPQAEQPESKPQAEQQRPDPSPPPQTSPAPEPPQRPATQREPATRQQPQVPAKEPQEHKHGWRKIEKDKITRPQVGSAENTGRSRKSGLLAEAKKQKWVQAVGIGFVILLLVVGFRAFNGGTTYDAYCVDQRTQTRVVNGVACEDEEDTNHRWWYTSDQEDAPDVGDSIDSDAGTFDRPTGEGDTIREHVEAEDG